MIKTTSMIFNTEMVRALLAGSKTQTRRPVADWQLPSKTSDDTAGLEYMSTVVRGRWGFGAFGATAEEAMDNYNGEYNCENPYGRAGSLIYVRETFGFSDPDYYDYETPMDVVYLAALNRPVTRMPEKWKPSIHMPRWASRLTLKINSVRVERIQDISEEDAKKEGASFLRDVPDCDETLTEKQLFGFLWDSVYPKSWSKNQWVWVVDFEVIHKNIDQVLAEMEQAE